MTSHGNTRHTATLLFSAAIVDRHLDRRLLGEQRFPSTRVASYMERLAKGAGYWSHLRLCILLCAASGCALPSSRAQTPGAEIGRRADEELSRRAASGWSGAAIVEYQGRVVLRKGYGLADRERRITFTTQTVAQVGSITKQFTATAIVELASKGRLRLTDSVARYLPATQGQARAITLHELLTHTSGLPEYCGRDFDPTTADALVTECVNSASLESRGRFAYSNPGYSVLGLVVERVSGEPLEKYLREQFFTPLGMRDTGYQLDRAPSQGMAACYRNDVRQEPIASRIAKLGSAYWRIKGNGGMQASLEDMYLWSRALRENAILPREATELLMKPHAPQGAQAGASYGYGWFVRIDSAGRLEQVSHSGSDGVCVAALVWRPSQDAFFYIAGNVSGTSTQGAASALLRIIREMPSTGR